MQLICISYNILAQTYADMNFSHIDQNILQQNNRIRLIKEKILILDPDIICLQEVELKTADRDFLSDFINIGYEYFKHEITKTRTNIIGNIILWRKNKFELLETNENSTTIFVKLKHNNDFFVIGNTHLKAGLVSGETTRKSQLESTIKICDTFSESIVICGDFNDELRENGLLKKILDKNNFDIHPFKNSCCVYNNKHNKYNYYSFDNVVSKSKHFDINILNNNSRDPMPSELEPSDHYLCKFIIGKN